MSEEPITYEGTWCAPDCPFLDQSAVTESLDKPARCKRHNVALDWYDYWLAACIEESPNPG